MSTRIAQGAMTLFAAALLLFGGCSNSLTEPEVAESAMYFGENPQSQQDIKWISWNDEAMSTLSSLGKRGSTSKLIQWDKGGIVGGEQTFGNQVEIPAYALTEDQRISVTVSCMDGNEPCGAEVEFLPNYQFTTDVTVTLSYAYLDFTGDALDLKIYWYDEDTGLWVELEGIVVDEENKTILVQIDHFTRYGWSL